MNDKLLYLYNNIQEGKIHKEEAAEQLRSWIAASGRDERFAALLSEKFPEWLAEPSPQSMLDEKLLQEKAADYLKKLLSSVIGLPVNRIEVNADLDKYGIDSLMVMQLTEQLETVFGSLSKTLFFEYRNIRELAGYLLKSHREQLVSQLQLSAVPVSSHGNGISSGIRDEINSATRHEIGTSSAWSKRTGRGEKKRRKDTRQALVAEASSAHQETEYTRDIAIIGLSGRYPGARNMQQLWNNLKEGKDCITEIPQDRWSIHITGPDHFAMDSGADGLRGGFLDGVDQFDPLFFNISPREAEIIDPQERLFLQCVYEAMEDAGYTREALGAPRDSGGKPGNVGVYVGVMYEEYQLYGAQAQMLGENIALNGNPSSIANRVSYFCNFHGPSMAVDTMCSSSLTAIHLACQSLQSGECDTAVAGGVNISIHPNKYVMLVQGKFLSSKGRCESFGEGGDGYVPGEGVGAILLKPLAHAIADGDHIYGIIKGTAINHGGKTNGYTVPNPNAQADVIGKAIRESGIDPRTLSYLEAHGTGTSLGDPIEIAGLSKAFLEYTSDTQFCAIGSAKSNIGHCESAAGIAGVSKVLLQLKHRQLAPSIHSQTLNPNIEFGSTPFMVQQELGEWQRPVLDLGKDGKLKEYPRRAGISSFGAGGSNAHVVIEEYIPEETSVHSAAASPQGQHMIVLSARTAERLKERARLLLEAIEVQGYTDEHLEDIAYTLQIGREAMEERLGIMAGSVGDIARTLKGYLDDGDHYEGVYRGQVKRSKEALAIFTADDDADELLEKWFANHKYSKLLELWVKGYNLNWHELYKRARTQRISLPAYPFARERYWAPDSDLLSKFSPESARESAAAYLHPLLHRNTSDIYEQRFSSLFTGREFFFKDHVAKGHKMMPGAAQLELARAAVAKSCGLHDVNSGMVRLEQTVWKSPIQLDQEPVNVHIGLYPAGNGKINYEIYLEHAETGARKICVQGRAEINEPHEVPSLDLAALQARCNQGVLAPAQLYDAFQKMGLQYGDGHRAVERIFIGEGEVLAQLSLPSALTATSGEYVLHPSLMDAALQAGLGLDWDGQSESQEKLKPKLPFAMDELQVYRRCADRMWARIKYGEGCTPQDRVQKLDIDVCDEEGHVCASIKGFSSRVLEAVNREGAEPSVMNTLLFAPEWKRQEAAGEETRPDLSQHIILLCEMNDKLAEHLYRVHNKADCVALKLKDGEIEQRFQAYAVRAFEQIQAVLQDKPAGNMLIQIVIPNEGDGRLFSGLSGLLQTAHQEYSKLIGQLIEVDADEAEDEIAKKLLENQSSLQDSHIRYADGKRWIREWGAIEQPHGNSGEESNLPWKDGGVYLITGGTGGLGRIFAKEIACQVKEPVLILTGRAALDADKQMMLDELTELGARAEYRQADVTDYSTVAQLIQSIKKKHRTLSGIIHCAGVIKDHLIFNKEIAEIKEVLGPKVAGLVNLDEASKKEELEFFILFSSITGVLGNPGQADYAMGNAFMDAYAGYRNGLAGSGERHGHTLSVNWPLWKEGGMTVDAETETLLMQSTGMIPMEINAGLAALNRAMHSGRTQVLAAQGNISRMREKLFAKKSAAIPPIIHRNGAAESGGEQWLEKTCSALAQIVSDMLKVKAGDVYPDVEFNEYGFESVTLTELANTLNQAYALDLTPTLFFEHSTIQELAVYLLKAYPAVFAPACAEMDIREHEMQTDPVVEVPGTDFESARIRRPRFADHHVPANWKRELPKQEPIAIIGMSGTFPMAASVDQLWDNLLKGKDCISEIPQDRWDWREYFGDPTSGDNKTNIKWGGFIDGVDEFDPLFFGISPKEAEYMDPQQRLLMTYVWKAIEDAGYSAQALSGTPLGMFIGTAGSGYSELLAKANVNIEGYTFTGKVPSVGPNRMSYFLNVHGPSEPVETACSSSLVAVHRAVLAIRNGECETAIAGGVSTILTPDGHISFNKAGMLSPDGRCKTFSDQANGYVRGEGVGMIFLKRLGDAEQAGDHIYGVIRGTEVNHGGRANSMTAPNPKAQAELLKAAYTKADIDIRTVSYIEAHGTGTPLGDPIEINGLKMAFKDLLPASREMESQAYCGLGSVKSNIGHLELSAGIAGMIKILLQMKHRTLVKTLHCEQLNSYIDLKDSPFYIVQENQEWTPLKGTDGEGLPRRAGVSSFGFGGANAHVIVEEYVPNVRAGNRAAITPEKPGLFVLSAKSEERLQEQALQLSAALAEKGFMDDQLEDIAYTLLTGREAMEERLGLLAGSVQELQHKLKAYAERGELLQDVYKGQARRDKDTWVSFAADEDIQQAIASWAEKKKYAKLLDLWVKGLSFDWSKIFAGRSPRRISLPTYPFTRERYWVPKAENRPAGSPAAPAAVATRHLSKPQDTKPAADNQPTADGPSILTPMWEPCPASRTEAPFPAEDECMVVIGGSNAVRHKIRDLYPAAHLLNIEPGNTIDEITEMLDGVGTVQHLVWMPPIPGKAVLTDEALLAGQEEGVIQLFRIVKSLLGLGYGSLTLGWTLITVQAQPVHKFDEVNPAHASLHGLAGSLAKEYAHWNLRIVDLEDGADWPLDEIFALPPDPQGNGLVYRDQEWHRQKLVPVINHQPERSAYKTGGVYVVIGGSGGVGEAWSEYMIRTYQAQIIWIGRRPMDKDIREKLYRLSEAGPSPSYISADAADRGELERAYLEIKQQHGRIDGVIHSAVVLLDKTIINMDEERFRTVLSVKADVSVNMARVFQDEPLDFILFFSSFNAFAKLPGSSNYSAGCMFKDAFAHRLALERPCEVKVMNWGYWGTTGKTADEDFQQRMNRLGVGSVEPWEAMEALELLLAGPINQMALMNMTRTMDAMKVDRENFIEVV